MPSVLDQLLDAFLRLGLKPSEVKVYLACLNQKDGIFAHEISDATKIKRTTVDLILKRLLERGYITRSRSERRNRFFAQDPEAVIFRQEQVVDDLKDLLPFMKRFGFRETDTEMRFFEGADGIRAMYDDMFLTMRMADHREQLNISSGAHIKKLIPDADKFIIGRRLKLNYPIRIIAPSSSRSETGWMTDKKLLREVRYFDEKKFPFQISIDIYGDKFSLFSPVKPVSGLIIRNMKIAVSMRAFFEMVWISLEKS